MYANSSSSYWNERKNHGKKKLPLSLLVLVCVLFLAVVVGAAYIYTTHPTSSQGLTQRRALHETTEHHWKQCESRVNSGQECAAICQPERNSLQRKTMHQACLHGCKQAHVAATSLACRGKVASEGEVFEEIGGLAYLACSKFQATEPKPETFASCRKYHRAGVKRGFRLGSEAMKFILDEEWDEIRNGSKEVKLDAKNST